MGVNSLPLGCATSDLELYLVAIKIHVVWKMFQVTSRFCNTVALITIMMNKVSLEFKIHAK